MVNVPIDFVVAVCIVIGCSEHKQSLIPTRKQYSSCNMTNRLNSRYSFIVQNQSFNVSYK